MYQGLGQLFLHDPLILIVLLLNQYNTAVDFTPYRNLGLGNPANFYTVLAGYLRIFDYDVVSLGNGTTVAIAVKCSGATSADCHLDNPNQTTDQSFPIVWFLSPSDTTTYTEKQLTRVSKYVSLVGIGTDKVLVSLMTTTPYNMFIYGFQFSGGVVTDYFAEKQIFVNASGSLDASIGQHLWLESANKVYICYTIDDKLYNNILDLSDFSLEGQVQVFDFPPLGEKGFPITFKYPSGYLSFSYYSTTKNRLLLDNTFTYVAASETQIQNIDSTARSFYVVQDPVSYRLLYIQSDGTKTDIFFEDELYLMDETGIVLCDLSALFKFEKSSLVFYKNVAYIFGEFAERLSTSPNVYSDKIFAISIDLTTVTDNTTCGNAVVSTKVAIINDSFQELNNQNNGYKTKANLNVTPSLTTVDIIYMLDTKVHLASILIEENCPFMCQTCVSGSQTECEVCRGDRVKNDSNQCLCTAPKIDDGSSENCVSCSYSCSTCENSVSNCLTCDSSNFRTISGTTCPCDSHYFDVPSQPICSMCEIQCLDCTGIADGCTSCQGANREDQNLTPKCRCSDHYFQVDSNTQDCQECPHTCQLCSSQNLCTSCPTSSNRDSGTALCDCITHFFNDGTNPICQECEYYCQECTGNASTCIGCLGTGRDPNSNCDCLQGGYDDGSNANCVACDDSCLECNVSGCITCKGLNREPSDGDAQVCVCIGVNAPAVTPAPISYLPAETYSCTSCTVGVFYVEFISLDSIQLIFTDAITVPSQSNLNIPSLANCGILFNDFSLFGQFPECSITSDKIIIQFSYVALFQLDSVIQTFLNPNLIHRDLCTASEFFTQFAQILPTTLKSPDLDVIPQPQLIFQGDILQDKMISPLTEVIIYFDQQNVQQDGKQDIQGLTYILKSNGSIVKSDITSKFNNKKLLRFDRMELDPSTSYELQINYSNFLGVSNQNIITFDTVNMEDYIKISPIKNSNLQFVQWKPQILDFDVNFYSYQNGEFKFTQREYKYSIYQTDSGYNIVTTLVDQQQQAADQFKIEYIIPAYTHTPGQYYMKVLIESLDNSAISSYTQFSYFIKETDPVAFIQGGSRIHAYSEDLDVVAVTQDLNVETNQDAGFTLTWQCEDLTENDVCKDIGNQPVTIDTNGQQQQFQGKLFKPFSTLLFTVNVVKGSFDQDKTVTIVIMDTNLPNFSVSLPSSAILYPINLQDEIQVDLFYAAGLNNPNLQFNMMFLYKYEKVALKVQEFSSFSFRIWDLFQDFDLALPEFILRVTLYDPLYFMPSENSFNLKVNIPPQVDSISITPQNGGISLETLYDISISGVGDVNLPITFRFYYYLNEQDYTKDKDLGGLSPEGTKNLLHDEVRYDSLQTYLPRQSNDNDDLFVMVQVIDSLGGITNVTQSVQVTYQQDSQQIITNMNNIFNDYQQQDQQRQSTVLNIIAQEMYQIQQQQQINVRDNQQYQEIKTKVYEELKILKDIQLSEVLRDQIIKSINLLLKDQDFKDSLQVSEKLNILDEMDTLLNQISSNFDIIINTGLLYTGDAIVSKRQTQNQDILAKSLNLFDNLSSVPQTARLRQLQSSDQENDKLQDNLQKTSKLYSKVSLPNADPVTLNGENLNVYIQKQTAHKAKEVFFDEPILDYGVDGQQNTDNFNDETQDGQQDNQIYNTNFNGFKENILKNESSFPYSNQDNALQEISIKKQGEENNISIQKPPNMKFQQTQATSSNNNLQTCIQKNKQQKKWDSKQCQTIEEEDDEGNISINCKCHDLNPTTVINDIENLFADSNVNEAFSGEGLKALAEFEFFKAIIFYIFVTTLIAFSILIYKGFQWDKKDISSKIESQPLQRIRLMDEKEEVKVKNNKLEQTNNNEIISSTSRKQSIDNINVQFNKESSKIDVQSIEDIEKKTDDKENINNNNNEKSSEFQQQEQQNSLKDNNIVIINPETNDQDDKSSLNNQDNKSNLNDIENKSNGKDANQDTDSQFNLDNKKKRKRKVKGAQSQNSLFISGNNSNSSGEKQNEKKLSKFSVENQQNTNDLQVKNKNSVQEDQISQKQMIEKELESNNLLINQQDQSNNNENSKNQLVFVIGMLFFHEFSSIFLVYIDKLPRPIRFLLFYIRILMVMSISTLFAGNFTQYQQILLNVIISIFIAIPHLILKTLYKCNNIVAKLLLVFISVGVIGLAIYTGLVGAALMGLEESNEWTIGFITSLMADLLMVQTIAGFLKAIVLFKFMGKKDKNGKIVRKQLLKEEGQQFIVSQKLQQPLDQFQDSKSQ